MSKKDDPLDAAPGQTPELLQKELSLDRRRRAPEVTQLTPKTEASTTDPMQPSVERPPPPTPMQWSQQQQEQRAARPGPIVTAQPVERASQPRAQQAPPRPPAPRAAPLPPAPVPQSSSSALDAMSRLPVVHERTDDELPTILVSPGMLPPAPPAPPPAPVRATARPLVPPRQSYRELPGALPAHLLVTQPQMAAPARQPGRQPRQTAREPQPPIAAERPAALTDLEPAAELEAAEVAAPADHIAAPATVRRHAPAQKDEVTAAPASLFRRVGAWLIDVTCIGGVATLFLLAALFIIAPKGAVLLKSLGAVVLPAALLAGLLAFVYTTVFAFFFHGRTPGRRLFGIHLVDTSGTAPGPARALFRAALALVSFALFLSGFWLALFDRHGQTLHDKLTGTFVVRLLDA